MSEITRCAVSHGSDGVCVSITARLKFGEAIPRVPESGSLADPSLDYQNLVAAVDRYISGLFGGRAPQPIRLPLQAAFLDRNEQE